MLTCIPLHQAWVDTTKYDLKGVYARRRENNYGQPVDQDGQVVSDADAVWDMTTTGLPLRRHRDWDNKGFRYITLADEESLNTAAPWIRAGYRGMNGDVMPPSDPNTLVHDTRRRSPWNPELYKAGVVERQGAGDDLMVARIREHGIDAFTAIMRDMHGDDWTVPERVAARLKPAPKRKAQATA